MIVPLTIGLIFILIYTVFNSLAHSTLIIAIACRRAFKTDQLCALNFDQGLKPPVIGMAVDKCNVFSKFGVSSRLVGIL